MYNINMDKKMILNKIIEQKGSCIGLNTHCHICPFNRAAKRKDGSYESCVEFLNASSASSHKQDEIYLKAATAKLLEIEIHEMLSDKST